MVSDFIKKQYELYHLHKSSMVLPLSSICDDTLQQYIRLVYNTSYADINDEEKIKHVINFNKNFSFYKYLETKEKEIVSKEPILVSEDVPIYVDIFSNNLVLTEDREIIMFKECRVNAREHIESDKKNHRYLKELSFAMFALRVPNIDKATLIIYSPNSDSNQGLIKEYEFSTTDSEWVNSTIYGETVQKLKELYKQILSGQEPGVCSDTWNGSKCNRYCDYASHKTGLCKYHKAGEV